METDAIEKVLAVHVSFVIVVERGTIQCSCGHIFAPVKGSFVLAHRAHVAAQIKAALDAEAAQKGKE
jgi:hypothetical protein